MVIKFLYLTIVLSILYACSAVRYLPKELEGVYQQKENKNVQLKLDGDKFLYIDKNEQTHLPPYFCCDTIAYGYWELVSHDLIKLYSNASLFLPVKLIVNEKTIEVDSVVIDIINPIESYYENNNIKGRDVI
jgi:hypothetical protein